MQHVEQGGRRVAGVVGHLVRQVVVEVERHDVDDRDPGPGSHRVLQHVGAALVDPGGVGRDRVDELDDAVAARGPVLDHGDGLVAPVDAGVVVERVLLGVQVEAGQVVGREHVLVGRGDGGHAMATVGQLGVVAVGRGTAERRDHLAALGLQGGDALGVGPDRGVRVAVPVHGAGARLRGLQEVEGEVLDARRASGLGQGVGRADVGLEHVRRQHDGRLMRRGRAGRGRAGRGRAGGRLGRDRRGGQADRSVDGQAGRAGQRRQGPA